MARILPLIAFFAMLAAADAALGRWGSAAIRERPRPAGRLTILFVAVLGFGAVVTLLARVVAGDTVLAVVVAVAEFPLSVGVILGVDRLLPNRVR